MYCIDFDRRRSQQSVTIKLVEGETTALRMANHISALHYNYHIII
jgi:hypothetical protein